MTAHAALKNACAAAAALATVVPTVATMPATVPATVAAALVLVAAPAGVRAQSAAPKAAPRRGPPPGPPPLPDASAEQLSAAALAHLGGYECEFNERVAVETHPRFAGYIDVKHKKSVWTMRPVLSSTGALRLEDVRGRMLMLQIADKSMLMDVQIGRRIVDQCVHEKQREATAARKASGERGESIGIDPSRAASAPTATVAPLPPPSTGAVGPADAARPPAVLPAPAAASAPPR